MRNFKSFRAARSILAGMESNYIIRESQSANGGARAMSFADQFSALEGVA